MHVFATRTSMHVLVTCIYTQKLQIFQISCKIAHEIRRIKKYLHVNACFKKFLANTRVFYTFTFDWVKCCLTIFF